MELGGLYMPKKRQPTENGIIIKKKLLDLNMTQKELAQRVGTSNVYLNDILHGGKSGKKYLNKIYRELGLTIQQIRLSQAICSPENGIRQKA